MLAFSDDGAAPQKSPRPYGVKQDSKGSAGTKTPAPHGSASQGACALPHAKMGEEEVKFARAERGEPSANRGGLVPDGASNRCVEAVVRMG